MVMQYLVARNEEYLRHIETFNKQTQEILEKLEVLEYNILEVQAYIKYQTPVNDVQKKEEWHDFIKQSKRL